jgi:hypothetical protein
LIMLHLGTVLRAYFDGLLPLSVPSAEACALMQAARASRQS